MTLNRKSNPEGKKKNKVRGIIFPVLKTTIIKTIIRQTYRPMEQNSESRNKLNVYGQLIFNKRAKNIQRREESLFNKCQENWEAKCKRIKLDYCLSPYTKINQNLNIRLETINYIEEN